MFEKKRKCGSARWLMILNLQQAIGCTVKVARTVIDLGSMLASVQEEEEQQNCMQLKSQQSHQEHELAKMAQGCKQAFILDGKEAEAHVVQYVEAVIAEIMQLTVTGFALVTISVVKHGNRRTWWTHCLWTGSLGWSAEPSGT